MRHEPAEIDEMTASRMERRLRTGARPNLTIGYERAWDVDLSWAMHGAVAQPCAARKQYYVFFVA
jgi:hypothetical protein